LNAIDLERYARSRGCREEKSEYHQIPPKRRHEFWNTERELNPTPSESGYCCQPCSTSSSPASPRYDHTSMSLLLFNH
jgi:hypothetical protein